LEVLLMGVLDAILTPEVLHGIVIIAVLAFTVRTLLIYSRESSELRPKFDTADRNLKQIRDGMAGQKKRVAELTKKVDPLQLRFDQMSELYEAGKKIEDDDERDAALNARRWILVAMTIQNSAASILLYTAIAATHPL
jgi:hypothetical protein